MYKYEIEINTRIEEVKDNPCFHKLVKEGWFRAAEMYFKSGMTINGRVGFDNHYEITVNGVQRKVGHDNWEPMATRIKSPYLESDEHFAGLYFIGCVGYNPVSDEYQYCVKIGKSSDIGNRLRQHSGSNPLLYHNNASLCVKGDLRLAEINCHKFLDHFAIGMPTGTNEWWFVDKDAYMKMCELFSNKNIFEAIASNGIVASKGI